MFSDESFAAQIAKTLGAEFGSGSAVWDEAGGPDATWRVVYLGSSMTHPTGLWGRGAQLTGAYGGTATVVVIPGELDPAGQARAEAAKEDK
jgi:hypothetical protein